jgi:hypothetical protein
MKHRSPAASTVQTQSVVKSDAPESRGKKRNTQRKGLFARILRMFRRKGPEAADRNNYPLF